MMRSLQAKLTLAMLLTSLTSVALVGLVARGMLHNKFDEIAMQQSLVQFRGMLQAYITTYGSWEKAQQTQDFRDFVRQQRLGVLPTGGAASSPVAPQAASNPPAPIQNPPAPTSAFPTGSLPTNPPQPFGQSNGSPPNGNPPNGNPPSGNPPFGAGQLPNGGQLPPGAPQDSRMQLGAPFSPSGHPNERPRRQPRGDGQQPEASPSGEVSFRFVVLAADGKVVMGPPELRGQPAPEDLRAHAEPVVVNGQTAAYVVPFGEPRYSQQDMNYINAMNQALLRGVLAATVLAVALGLYFGRRLSRRLRHLTGAIEAMGEGELRQKVTVEANDEVGVLAGAFNRMSAELAAAHEKLQESHAKISKQAQMLKELAVRDGLTKLHNRRFFDERGAHAFAQAKRYNRPMTVMIGDIDFFKRINDSFSHAIGDEVLRHVAAILQKNTRESDIVARYGGEEFVVAFPETDLLQALALCERLRLQIESYGWHNIHPDLRVTMSMGLNQDLTLESFEKLVAAADKRLYTAKETGRNRVCAPVNA